MKYGKTIIDHNIRIALGLTCEQYTFLDCIHQFTIKKKFVIKFEDIYTLTGLRAEEIYPSLKGTELLKVEGKKIRTTVKWEEMFVELDVVEETIKYFNLKAGTDYKSKTKSSVSNIQARNREGFTLEDFKCVIDSKVEDWLHDEKMRAYLRPITLFAPEKFESYLEFARAKVKPSAKKDMVI